MIFILPYAEMVITALRPNNELTSPGYFPRHWDFSNFTSIWKTGFGSSLGASLEIAKLLATFLGRPNGLSPSDSVDYLSTACALWTLRVWYGHEGNVCEMVPDPRDAVWIPMANEIERLTNKVEALVSEVRNAQHKHSSRAGH